MKRKADHGSEKQAVTENFLNRFSSWEIRRPKKQRTPRQWPSVWRKAVEVFYGNESDAWQWFYIYNSVLGAAPLDVLPDPTGRVWVMRDLEWLHRQKWQQKPLTSWLSCSSFSPSKQSGLLVFRGSDVLASALFYHLRKGGDIAEFLKQYPEVTADQVEIVFETICLDFS
jgi:uncharacterized protein (DUF433 family)